MAIKEYNVDLDVKGRILATDVPNSTGSIVTWNAATNVFGLRTNSQILSDLGLNTVVANSHTHTNKTVLDGITSANVNNWNTAFGWGNFRNYGLASSISLSDLDNQTLGSIGYTLSTTSNLSGLPYGSVINLGGSSGSGGNSFQIYGSYQDTSGIRYRRLRNGVLDNWVQVIDSNNLNSQATSLGFIKSSALSNYIPYTGANQPINFNTQKITHRGIVSNVDSITSPWLRHTSLTSSNKVAYLIIDGFTVNTNRQLYIEVESIAGNGEYKRLVKGFHVNFNSYNDIGPQRDSRYIEVTGTGNDIRYGIGEIEKHSDTALKIPLIWIDSVALSINKISVKAYTGSVSGLTFSVENDATSTLTTENPYLYRNASEKWVNEQIDNISIPTVDNLVPYTGANQPIDLNTQSFSIGGDFNKSFSNFERSQLNSSSTGILHFTRITDVASLSISNDTTSRDCIVITLPIKTSTRWVMEVDIFSSLSNNIFGGVPTKLLIDGRSGDNNPRSVTAISGANNVKSVSFCRDDNNNTVIIIRPQDDAPTNFRYGRVNIANFYHSQDYNADLAVKSNYKIEAVLESSLTGLTTNGTITNAQFNRDSYLWNKGDFSQTDINNWNTAYGWGDHAGLYQPLDADLTSIAGLSGTTGLLRKTAANTWSLDTNTYLTENQPITLSGDVTGSGSTSITTSIAANAVSFAKIQNIETGKILGRKTAGSGNIEELTPSDARDILDVPSMSYEKQGRVYYIVGDSGGTAGSWTGTSSEITEYFEGMVIAYQVKTAGASGGTTLNINGLGAIPVRYNNSNVTTQFPIDTIITLVYDGNYFRTHNYVDGSESYVVRYNQSLQVQAPASSYPLLGLGISTGKYHAIYKTNTINDVNDIELDVTGPLLLDNSSSAITVNTARTSSIYAGRGISYTSIIKGATGGTMHEPLFLVGTIGPNGGFIPHHSSGRLSYQIGKPTANVDNNGKLYWYVGYFYSSTSIRLEISHPCYLLTDDGEWVPYKQPQSLQDVVNINPAVVIPSGDKTISISSDETEVDYDLLNLTGYSNNNAYNVDRYVKFGLINGRLQFFNAQIQDNGSVANNLFFGAFALNSLRTDVNANQVDGNVAIGGSSLPNLTLGIGNLGLGGYAGWSQKSGNYNTFIGVSSALSGAGVNLTGSYNVLIGAFSGNNATVLNNSTIIGTISSSNLGTTNLTNEVVIGYGNGNIAFRKHQNGLTVVPKQTLALYNSDSTGKAIVTKEILENIINSIPAQLNLTAGPGISISGTYPNLTVTNTAPNVTQDLSSVLTAGNTTSSSIILSAGLYTSTFSPASTSILNPGTGKGVVINAVSSSIDFRHNATYRARISPQTLTQNSTHQLQDKDGVIAHLSDIDGAINIKMITIELTHAQVLALNTTPYNITSAMLGLQAGEKVKWLLDRCEWKVDSNGAPYDGSIRLYSLSSPICTISIKSDGHRAGPEIISSDGYLVSDTHYLSAWGTITGGTSGATVKIRLYYTTTTW